jgi:uncharacterized protein with ParB-like and HNH nuclease domain
VPIDERRYAKPNPPMQFDVESLFRDTSRLIIPSWQREYAWSGENEVEDLLSDLTKFVENPHRGNYLLGSIITFPKNRDRVVVDGQQRTVTLFILLCALHTILKRYLAADFPTGEAPESYKDTLDAIKRCIKHTTATSNFIPIEMEYGNGDLVLKKIIDDDVPNIDSVTQTQERIIEAYNYIKTYLNREFIEKSSLRNFAVGVMQGVFLSEISVSDLRQALEVFIKLNNRGKDLEDSDLVKNYLFQQVEDPANFVKISEKWANMSRNLRRSQGKAKLKNAEFFLRNWALYKKGSRLNGEYPVWEYWEEQLEIEEERENFLSCIEFKAKEFSNLIDSKLPTSGNENSFMQGVKHLGGTQHLPLVLAGTHLGIEQFEYLSKLVNARTITYQLSLERTQDFESLVPVWAKKISLLPENATNEEIDLTAIESDACLNLAQVTNFKSYLSTLTYSKQKKKVKLILATVAKEYQHRILQDDLSLSQYLIGYQASTRRGFDIDHIHPQSRIPEDTDLIDNATLYHGLGNLVIVNGRQRDYQDQMPVNKIPIYKEGSLLSKVLTPMDSDADQRTKEEWERIQVEVPYSLESWGMSEIEIRRDFIIEEFIQFLPDVIMGRKNF